MRENSAADLELGYVYLPTEAPTNDFYGGHRPGDNFNYTRLSNQRAQYAGAGACRLCPGRRMKLAAFCH